MGSQKWRTTSTRAHGSTPQRPQLGTHAPQPFHPSRQAYGMRSKWYRKKGGKYGIYAVTFVSGSGPTCSPRTTPTPHETGRGCAGKPQLAPASSCPFSGSAPQTWRPPAPPQGTLLHSQITEQGRGVCTTVSVGRPTRSVNQRSMKPTTDLVRQTCVRVQQLSQLIAYDAGRLSLSQYRETQCGSHVYRTSRCTL
jgi:hypothetical protein